MIVTAKHILDCIDEFAPWQSAEEWDNAGLLAGSESQPVRTILCALDLNAEVLSEARQAGADLIVTHHPILFRGRKNLREDDPEGALLCALIRSGIALIAAHTNFDVAQNGVNDALANRLHLQNAESTEWGGRIGSVDSVSLSALVKRLEGGLGDVVRFYGDPKKNIQRIAVMGGAGGDFAMQAFRLGADAFVTGEISYHKALDCQSMGMAVLEAGHRATEMPSVTAMAELLRDACARHEYIVKVKRSVQTLF